MIRLFHRSLAVLAFALVSSWLASDAQAAGLGLYLQDSNAWGEIDFGHDGLVKSGRYHRQKESYDQQRLGLGVLVDTNVARDELLNYRFEFGYQHSWRHFDAGHAIQGDGITMNHTLGFGLVRSERVRFWMGPAFRVSLDFLDDKDNFKNGYLENGSSSRIGGESAAVTFGGGPNFGVNWNVGRIYTVGMTASYQYMGLSERVDYGEKDRTYGGAEHLLSVGINVMFRTADDHYRP